MIIYLLPIIIIAIAVLSYILGKKNGITKEVIKTIQLPPVAIEETDLYGDETRHQFELRCHNALIQYLNESGFVYYRNENSFQVNLELEDGSTFLISIDSIYEFKCIEFKSRLSTTIIPDRKLSEVSEMINRLNARLVFNPFHLDYQDRHVNILTSYYVGNHSCITDYLSFYLTINYKAVKLRDCLKRVVVNNEEPALVALDFAS